MSSSLVVPLVVWGRNAPTHCISSMLMTPDQKHVVTGCNDGQLCVWDVTDNNTWQVHPQTMLFGHSAAVTCLSMGSASTAVSYIVSSADNGEMCLWDLTDGRCIENTKMSVIHTRVQTCQLVQCKDVRLVCNGFYPEIHIIHPLRLEILFSLCSQVQPDWISALCVLRPVKREENVVVAVSNSGMVKVWTIHGVEAQNTQQMYEDESKQIRCLNAQTLTCCAYNQRTVLIVCSKYWQIYDASDFSLLCSESSRRGERWIGGEFLSVDRVVVWSNEGRGYLYELPTKASLHSISSSNPDSPQYRQTGDPSSARQPGPNPYTILDIFSPKGLDCVPAMMYMLGRREKESKLLLRGDSEGRLSVWVVPEVTEVKRKLVRQESFENLPVVQPKFSTSLTEEWKRIEPTPEGLLDKLVCPHQTTNANTTEEGLVLEITASTYLLSQGKLACGRSDGSIIVLPASDIIITMLFSTRHSTDSVHKQILRGHEGRVSCVLYPHNESSRYDQTLLLSGGVDFSVILWDLQQGTKLHSYCVQAGEITQLIVPPENCNPRVLSSVCSVASDHSLSLLSIRERKCILLASCQLFPIQTVKWRPHDDFVLIGCTDGTVYVWQMETGHLDRVVQGSTAEEILAACDEKLDIGDKLTDPTISVAQAFKRHNLATFRNLAQQQIKKAQSAMEQKTMRQTHPSLVLRSHAAAMMIQGLRTNVRDPEAHVVYFDTEAIIVQLVSEQYAAFTPNSLENMGFITSVPLDPGLTDTQKKVVDFISKVKDKADDVTKKIQLKAETAGLKSSPGPQRRADGSEIPASGEAGARAPPRPPPPGAKNPLPLEEPASEPSSPILIITQILMSCLHAWGLDKALDKLCLNELKLLHPRTPMSFGFLSRGGYMSVLLPGWSKNLTTGQQALSAASKELASTSGHWQVSSAVTTQHLLSMISITHTRLIMSDVSLKQSKPVEENISHQLAAASAAFRAGAAAVTDTSEGQSEAERKEHKMKQAWSLLAALHCILLPDLIGKAVYKPPLLEMLARRWQDRCLEIREAAQSLLLAELNRIGAEGRKQVIDDWSPFLPSFDTTTGASGGADHPVGGSGVGPLVDFSDELDEEDDIGMDSGDVVRGGVSNETRRKQATAIVMMGVMGAEFGASMKGEGVDERKSIADGFSLQNYTHSRNTSKALSYLLNEKPSPHLPAHSMIRRAAVDLLGRGFTVWEPYLDVSKVLLDILELCVDGDRLVPSMTFGLPLSQRADACRTARHALSLIASARPPAFIITLAREVARHNALAQNAQSQHHHNQLHNSVLVRAKPEILRAITQLLEKIPNDVVDLLTEITDVVVHCLDQSAVKQKGFREVFPAICTFHMVSYCHNTRRICVGAKTGGLAIYDLKQGKCQTLSAHNGGVSAVAFSFDGKALASHSIHDNRLLLWQSASTSLFNMGSQQLRCMKTFNTPPVTRPPGSNPIKLVKLEWVDNRTVKLMTADGSETRYRV